MISKQTHHEWAEKFDCAPIIDVNHPIISCLRQKTRKITGMLFASLDVVVSKMKQSNRRSKAMKKDSSIFLHRLLLWGVLLFGATLLLVNAWFIMNTESGLLFTATTIQ
jgi:hypothetical protein